MDKKKILIVEDDEVIRNLLGELLVGEDYDVESSCNGQEAFDYLRAGGEANLILLDLMMPVKDGYSFRNEQLADPQIAHIPVVVMSADNMISQRNKSIKADAHLAKPIDLDTLFDAVKKYAQ